MRPHPLYPDSQPASKAAVPGELEALFDILPISVWIEDFSKVYKIREGLLKAGVREFRAYLESHEEVVLACLDAVKVLAVNDETLRLHDAPSRAQLLEGLAATFTPRSLDTFREELIQLFEGQTASTLESELKTLSGVPREVMVYVSVDPSVPNWGRAFVLLADITEQKQVERELRLHEAFLRETERVGQIGGWSLDAQTREMRWTEEVFRIFGLDPSEPPRLEEALLQYPPEARQELSSALEACINEARPYDLELPFVDADGRQRWTRSVGHAEVSAGRVARVTGTLQDVTSRRAAEERRRALEADTMHNQKLKSLGVLAGGIAHDFNNILSAVIGNAELAINEVPCQSVCRGRLVEIRREAQRAARLAGQMLAYSGRGHFTKDVIHPAAFMAELGDMLDVAISKKTELRFTIPDELPPLAMDSSQLQQVLVNLVMNASEALEGEAGHVEVSLGREALSERDLLHLEEGYPLLHEAPPAPGDYLVIGVLDDGCGMEPQTRRQLLDPFFTTKFTGRGLGMAAVAGVLRSNAGAISIDSAPGEGTSIKVYLPYVLAEVPQHESETAGPPPLPAPGRVLVADDEDAVRRVLAATLERLGYGVVEALDGQQALELFELQGDQLQLSIIDITMPGLDGVEVFDRLHAAYPSHPVILTSGYDAVGLGPRLGDREPQAFLQKPFTLDEVKAALATALGVCRA